MQVSELKIDRYGVWADLQLHLETDRLNVFYGPNEAGKTTLMRFVQGILYGFDPAPERHQRFGSTSESWSGSVIAEHRSELYELQRKIQRSSGQSQLQITGTTDSRPDESILSSLLQNIDRSTYEHVFAVGLQELQQLAALNETEAAQSLYDLTLGVEGQSLIRAFQDVDRRSARLATPESHQGRLRHLLSRRQQIQDELAALADARDRFTACNGDLDRLESQLAGNRRKLKELEQQLAAHQYLERICRPWQRIQELESELRSLPDFAGFPNHAEARLAELDQEIQSAEQLQKAAEQAADQVKHQLGLSAGQDKLQRFAGTIQGHLDLRSWLEDLENQIEQARQRVDASHRELEHQLAQLGPKWTADRIAHTDTSPQATIRLLDQARAMERARWKFKRTRNHVTRLAKRLQKRRSRIDQHLRENNVKSIVQSLQQADRRIQLLREACNLQIEQEQLQQQQSHLDHRLNSKAESVPLPPWVNGVMSGFIGIGAILITFGLYSAIRVSTIAGLIYVLLGLTWWGFRYGLKQHLTTTESIDADELRSKARETQNRLTAVTQQLNLLRRQLDLDIAVGKSAPNQNTATNQLEQLTQRLSQEIQRHAELERLATASERLDHYRDRLREFKSSVQTARREYQTAREAWDEQLHTLGIDDSKSVEQAFRRWQRIVIAAQKRIAWNRAKRELEGQERTHTSHARRLSELARRMGQTAAAQLTPLKILDAWTLDLEQLDQQEDERTRLRREERQKRDEAAEYQQLAEEARREQSLLLVRAGAQTRDEFEQRALERLRRDEINEQLSEARRELKQLSQHEPEIAITEQDLKSFDSKTNQQHIQRCLREREELEDSVRATHEQLGHLKHDLEACQDDRRPTQLRFELSQIDAELKESAEEWFALQHAGLLLNDLRIDFEQSQQPATLQRASQYLAQLTGGRYRSIWCPLGSQQLCVLADRNQSFTLDQLSGGTREQLFLAIRLALIENFAAEGIELPIILDDLFVNFDQIRTEAAVETLIDFASAGRQVLFFTCHLHLAHLFESRGIDPTWLPTQDQVRDERRVG